MLIRERPIGPNSEDSKKNGKTKKGPITNALNQPTDTFTEGVGRQSMDDLERVRVDTGHPGTCGKLENWKRMVTRQAGCAHRAREAGRSPALLFLPGINSAEFEKSQVETALALSWEGGCDDSPAGPG